MALPRFAWIVVVVVAVGGRRAEPHRTGHERTLPHAGLQHRADHARRPGLPPRGNARDQPAISAAMNASSQPAYLRLPFRLAFSVTSARARFSAILRRSARLRAAFGRGPRLRAGFPPPPRLASSRKVTSSPQCSPFSTRQWLRIAAASASGGSLALGREWRISGFTLPPPG